jgi:hypothetical protein
MNFRPLLVALPVSLIAAAGVAWFAMPATANNPGPQLAQTQPAQPPAASTDTGPQRSFSPQKACYDRNARAIGHRAYMKARLDLTPQQMPLWNAFEKASDDASAKQKARCATLPAEMTEQPSLTDRMNRREDAMKARLEAIQAVKPSLTALYASLTPEQKEIVDSAGNRRMGRHGQRHHR